MPTLHWIGKEKVISHHQDVPYRVLEHKYGFKADPFSGSGEEQKEPTNSGNKIIHGDNLEALKSLLPEYEGKIKCIYIDPPYNTGNEGWVYNDNVNHPKIKKWLGEVVGKEGEDLTRHDKWLCMMYPRIKLLHKLLADDGSIWISIDDKEVHRLRFLLDEIFGENKFIACNVWQKRYSRENRGAIGDSHEYILVYANNPEGFKQDRNKLSLGEKQQKLYKNPDKDINGPWQSISLTAQGFRPNQMYKIIGPTGIVHSPPDGTCWKVVEENFLTLQKDNKIYFGKDGKGVPRRKLYLKDAEGLVPWTWWPHEEVGHTDESRNQIKQIFGSQTAFETPKPTRLIERIINISSHKDSLILDSFAGSGTTGHAVLNLNKEDGGNRKFILIEMEDYANDITAERVKRVAKGYGTGSKAVAGTGGSFDFYELGLPLFDENQNLNEAVDLEKIREYIWFSETRSPYESRKNAYELGIKDSTVYYFIYEKDRLTTLDFDALELIKTKGEQYVIYADNCLLPKEFMAKKNIIFKKIPRDITRF